MSAAAAIDWVEDEISPLLVFGALFEARGWSCCTRSHEEVSAKVEANWGSYHLRFIRRRSDPVMQAVCLPEIRVPEAKQNLLARLLTLINEQVWLGHFEVWSHGNLLVYRHAFMLGDEGEVTLAQAQIVAETAIEECDRFYPAFQFALWSDKSPEEALEAAMIDAAGEA